MATINELLKEIDWDLYDDSDYEEDDRNMPSDELTGITVLINLLVRGAQN